MRQNKKNQGFTLVELLIVVAIIGILAAVLTPQFLNARKVAVDRAGEAYVSNVYTAVQAHIAQFGVMPNNDCSDGYDSDNEGTYSVADPNISALDCEIKGDIDTPSVNATWTGGTASGPGTGDGYTLPPSND